MSLGRSARQRFGSVPTVLLVGALLWASACKTSSGPSKPVGPTNLYLTQYVSNTVPGSVLIFPPTATGDVAPTTTISGANTALDDAHASAIDSDGNIYVTNNDNSSVTV
ncbi:MAG TPA: hypothetical protein VEG63_07510, partial [Candidatus Acidoferrales bacterium]|nr:hypothetical protein [Candidatus Acidoferrales bacterium]